MLPAADITLTIGRKTIALRPSLRAATHLECKYHGFDNLLTEIGDGSIGAMADVLSVATEHPDLLALIDGVPLSDVMPTLINSTSRHVCVSACKFDPLTGGIGVQN